MQDFLNRVKVISKKKKGGGLANNILNTTLEKCIECCQFTCKCLYEQVKKNKFTTYMYSLKRCYVAKKLFCVF